MLFLVYRIAESASHPNMQTPTPGLENLGLQTPTSTLALKSPENPRAQNQTPTPDSMTYCVTSSTDCVLTDDCSNYTPCPEKRGHYTFACNSAKF